MAFIKGYQFYYENTAIEAREKCDAFYGIPVRPDDVTQNWVEYQFAELNTPQFWYIRFDESLLPILGEAFEFEIYERPVG
jgi:hypothetical protein